MRNTTKKIGTIHRSANDLFRTSSVQSAPLPTKTETTKSTLYVTRGFSTKLCRRRRYKRRKEVLSKRFSKADLGQLLLLRWMRNKASTRLTKWSRLQASYSPLTKSFTTWKRSCWFTQLSSRYRSLSTKNRIIHTLDWCPASACLKPKMALLSSWETLLGTSEFLTYKPRDLWSHCTISNFFKLRCFA